MVISFEIRPLAALYPPSYKKFPLQISFEILILIITFCLYEQKLDKFLNLLQLLVINQLLSNTKLKLRIWAKIYNKCIHGLSTTSVMHLPCTIWSSLGEENLYLYQYCLTLGLQIKQKTFYIRNQNHIQNPSKYILKLIHIQRIQYL